MSFFLKIQKPIRLKMDRLLYFDIEILLIINDLLQYPKIKQHRPWTHAKTEAAIFAKTSPSVVNSSS